MVRGAAFDRPHPGHILARRNSTFQGNRERHSIVVVVVSVAVVSPLDIVGPASTAVAAASWPSVLVLLLGPALVDHVPQFSAVRALARLSVGVERLGRVLRLHRRRCRLLALPLDVLVREHLHNVLRAQLCIAHLQVEHDVLVALGETAQQADRHVLVLHLGADTAELGADVEDLVAMMQDIAAFRHLHAEELALQVDAPSLLRSTVQRLQARPRHPVFFTVVNHVVVVRVHVEQHQAERDVARLDVVVLGSSVGEGRSRLSVHHMPHRLGQEHATHVAVPRRVVVAVELVDGDLGRDVLGRGHGAWAHNLKGVTDLGRREGRGESLLGV
ncbi:hypothetical protein PC116_g26018 [Phytophthora cactorum]|nr:hypothetical protein PC116_g26018 [Phytophthora cactorum]